MVSKPVAAAGSVLGLTALAMLISVMMSQNFVVVTIPGKLDVYGTAESTGGAGTCQAPNYLGTLGIFKASYLPACAFNPAVVPPIATDAKNLQPYAQLDKAETPTTEFGPLFPAQTCFGGKFPASTGCKFTTCEEFYAEAGVTDKIAQGGALKSVLVSLPTIAKADADAQAKLVGLSDLTGLIPSLVTGAVASSLIGNGETSLNATYTRLSGIPRLVQFVTEFYYGGSGCIDPVLGSLSDRCTALIPFFEGATDEERIASFVKGPFSIFNVSSSLILAARTRFGLNDTKTLETFAGFLSFTRAFGTSKTQLMAATYNIQPPGGETVDVASYDGMKQYLKLFTNIAPTQLALAYYSFAACNASSSTASSPALCQNDTSYAVSPPSNVPDTASMPACVLLDSKVAGAMNRTATPFINCTYTSLFTTLKELLGKPTAIGSVLGPAASNLPSLLDAKGLKLEQLPGALQAIQQLCARSSWAGCPGFLRAFAAPAYAANFTGLPADFSKPFAATVGVSLLIGGLVAQVPPALQPVLQGVLAGLLPPSFSSLLKTLAGPNVEALLKNVPANLLPPEVATLSALIPLAKVVKDCPNVECIVSIAPLYTLTYVALQVNESRAVRIADCLNNDKDISAFKTAQAMVTGASVMMGLGMAAGFAALAVDKSPVAFGAGALSAIGGVLVVAALMVVKGAPVYGKIGGTPVDGKPLYSGASGQLIAIVSGLLAVIGGITQAVSGCLSKAGSSSDQLTTKVENTY